MKPILSSSLINCHAEGMDSIVFKESSPMVRMFVCRPEHTLWRNHLDDGESFSVAIHMHRQDITMVPLCGQIWNVFFRRGAPQFSLSAFDYSSQIADGKGGFAPCGSRNEGLEMYPLCAPLFLRGDESHTVYVPKGQVAAWLICEGSPTQDYSSVCYTNDRNLDKTDFSSLYRPMTAERLEEDMVISSGQIAGARTHL